MSLGPHAYFIVMSYAAAALPLGGLVLWVWLDYRAQNRALAALDRQGVARRSGQSALENAR
jgi:heme exporter protein D